MNQQNQFRLQFPVRSANEGFARAVISAFAAQLDPTLEELNDLKTAVSEAVTNCIVHAYPDGVGKITLSAALHESGVTVRVRDTGCGIPDIPRAMEPLYTTVGGERSGLGFAVMQTFCDKVTVRSAVGKGTTVVITKNFRKRIAVHGG